MHNSQFWLADLGDFDVRVGGLLLLLGTGLPALASDVPPLRVSTLLGEARRPVTLFESDELDPPELGMSRSLGEASQQMAAVEQGSEAGDVPLGKGIGTRISASETLAYDSNLFRLSGPAAARAAGLAGMGSWASQTRLGLGLEKSRAGQQWVLDYELGVPLRQLRVSRSHHADGHRPLALDGGAGLEGRAVGGAPGGAGRLRLLPQPAAQRRADPAGNGSAFYHLGAGWHLGVQAGQGSRRYPDGARPGNEIDFAGLDTVLRYAPESGAVVAVTRRRASGSYPNVPTGSGALAETSFEQDELFAEATLPLKSGTRLQLRLGNVSRSYGRYAQSDFSGHNGLAGLDWQLTPRTRVSAALRYDTEPAQDFVSSYVAVRGLRLGSLWEYSPKLRVEGRLEWRDAEYRGDPGFGRTGSGPARRQGRAGRAGRQLADRAAHARRRHADARAPGLQRGRAGF
jgi:hypothetical protein